MRIGLWALVMAATLNTPTTLADAETVAPAKLSVSLPADQRLPLDSHFLGLSYEKSKLATAFFVESNHGLVHLLNRLGHGVLRIGANAVDKTTWNPNGAGLTPGEIAPRDVDRLAQFIKHTGWKIVYGLNFATNTSAGMVSEASYAAKVLGSQLESFEIGNEPDLYQYNGIRPKNFTYTDFRGELEAYARALKTALPNIQLTGPATATGTENFNKPFSSDEAGRISQLTHHYYRGNGQAPESTVDLLLSPDPNLDTTFNGLIANSKSIPGGFRLAEANSFYNGGAPGVSNAFAAALWSLEFLFQNAIHHSGGVNFHGGNGPGADGGVPDEHAGGGYTPIADDGQGNVIDVRPVYYGMFLFSLAANGNLLETHLEGGNPGLTAYAVRRTDGITAIVLINKNRTVTSRVSVKARGVKTLLLSAPSLESISGYQIGGAAVDLAGNWHGLYTTALVKSGVATIDVPAASAILVEVK